MTNTPSTNAPKPASPAVPVRRDWAKPVLDILELAKAENQAGTLTDNHGLHKST